ncbi:MAG: hypothetical protein H7101_13620 [Deinococcales bacterium]|nr:hypothetical protein [Chitinophagaceae bacterium]
MKLLFCVSFFFAACTSLAQSPLPPAKPANPCSICSTVFPTSVNQLTDITKKDKCYTALQTLVEEWGVDVSLCSDYTFKPKDNFTNAMFVKLFNSTQDRINELIGTTFTEYTDEKGNSIAGRSMKNKDGYEKSAIILSQFSYDLHKHNFTSISQVKDVKETDCYYRDAQSLVERYGIDITNKEGLLAADEVINVADAAKILNKCWVLTKFDPKNYDKTNTTKSNFIVLFSDALNEYRKFLEDYAKEK